MSSTSAPPGSPSLSYASCARPEVANIDRSLAAAGADPRDTSRDLVRIPLHDRSAARRARGARMSQDDPTNDDDGLDRLSSEALHDLAVSYAKRHLDVRFFWELMRLLPAAEAAAGRLDEAEEDVMRLSAHADDV